MRGFIGAVLVLVGCVGGVSETDSNSSFEPQAETTRDVVSVTEGSSSASANEDVKSEPVATIPDAKSDVPAGPAETTEEPGVPPTVQPEAPAVAPVAPVTPAAPAPVAPDCSAPVPSAVDESGRQQAYTADGRQTCGGKVTKCGFTWGMTMPCEQNDLCGGEGTPTGGGWDEERYICATCRVETDDAAACGGQVMLAGCATSESWNELHGCRGAVVAGSDGRTRSVQCCDRVPFDL